MAAERTTRIALAAAAIALFALLAVACGSPSDPGEQLPNIGGETYNNGRFDLTEVTGRPLVVNFWYPSCPPCAAELPDLQEAYERHGDEVDFVGVFLPFVDREANARAFLEETGVRYPSLTDESQQSVLDFGITSFPTTLFINEARTEVVQRYVGGPILPDELDSLITALLEG